MEAIKRGLRVPFLLWGKKSLLCQRRWQGWWWGGCSWEGCKVGGGGQGGGHGTKACWAAEVKFPHRRRHLQQQQQQQAHRNVCLWESSGGSIVVCRASCSANTAELQDWRGSPEGGRPGYHNNRGIVQACWLSKCRLKPLRRNCYDPDRQFPAPAAF